MAPRANWKGFLRLSLVTCPVALYPATSDSEKVSFNQINRKTGHRIKYTKVDADTGEEVANEDIIKGYKVDTDTYIEVTKDELDDIALESTHTIEIDEFVPKADIDNRYLIRPYYLVPDGSVAEEGYRVIREALRETGKIAVGQVVINGQERIMAIRPLGTGLLGNSLRYEDEIRKPEDYFGSIGADSVDEDQLAIMDQIIKRKTRPFDPGEFVDHYQQAVRELIEKKLEGKLPEKAPERKPAQVISLMDALKRSLAAEEKPAEASSRRTAERSSTRAEAEKPAKTAPRGRKAPAGQSAQRNLLLPVEGGRGKGEKPAAARRAEPAPTRSRKRA